MLEMGSNLYQIEKSAMKSYGGTSRGRWMEGKESMSDELREGKINILVLIMIG